MNKKYIKNKTRAINKAIEYQHLASATCFSYSEIALKTEYFTKLGKRYGLLTEFRENGII